MNNIIIIVNAFCVWDLVCKYNKSHLMIRYFDERKCLGKLKDEFKTLDFRLCKVCMRVHNFQSDSFFICY